MRIVTIGGSVAGLALGIFAARRGHQVTVLDADPLTDPGLGFDERAARLTRGPTPQAAHSHAFLALARRILADEAPEVLAALTDLGAETVALADRLPATLADRSPRPGDGQLVATLARRSTFEAALRLVAASQPGLQLRAGTTVTGLVVDGPGRPTGAPPHVVGVEVAPNGGGRSTTAPPGGRRGRHRPEQLRAELVVDASGRRGRVPAWLADLGVEVATTESECGIAYYSRFYRLHLGERTGPLNRGYTAGSSFDRYSALVFPADNDTFSVTFGILPEDGPLRKLRHDEAFHAAAGSIPVVAGWVERATPVTPSRSMMGLTNRLRRLVDPATGRPLVTGLVAIADAAAISNPAHSRGCSLALAHALGLARLLDTGPSPDELAPAADAVVDELLRPWVEDSHRQDQARLARWRPDGGHGAPEVPAGEVTNGQAWVAAHHDREVWSAFTRLQQLLATGPEVLADPEVVSRVGRVADAGLGLPALPAPTHDELAALVAANAPAPGRGEPGRLARAV